MAERDDPPPYTATCLEVGATKCYDPPNAVGNSYSLGNGETVKYIPHPEKEKSPEKLIIENGNTSKMDLPPASPEIELLESKMIRLPSCPDGEEVVLEPEPEPETCTVGTRLYKPVSDDALDDPPTDYLCGAILVTIFCFFPTGAIAVIFAILSEVASQRDNDLRKAHQYTRIASVLVKLSVCLGVISGIVAIIVTLVALDVI